MVCCCFVCLPATGSTTDKHLPIAGMSSSPFVNFCLLKPNLRFSSSRLLFPRKMRFKFVVCAEITNSLSSPNARFNFQSNIHSYNTSQFPWIGPVPGDIAEIEAYCRIFRAAEALHAALMNTLCNPFTGVCSIPYDFPVEEKPILEDKIVSVLGCLLSLLNKGREDVLSGRSSVTSIFQDTDLAAIEDKLPPLVIFRNEMKRCCESLHVALENFLTPGPDSDQDLDTWRKLQRLKNVCYDSGFPREGDYPCHQLFANWSPVYLSDSKDEITLKDAEAAFYMGGQVTEEGLNWLIEKGYGTIIDLKEENMKDSFYQVALDATVSSGKIEVVNIPVEVGTAPTMRQVEQFASLVSDCRKKPIYLHSKEGVWRTSSMVSRWRQYMSRCAAKPVNNQLVSTEDAAALPISALGNSHISFMDEETSAFNEQDNSSQKNIVKNMDIVHNLNEAFAATVCLNGTHGSGGISRNTTSNFTFQGLGSAESSASGVNPQGNTSTDIDPLKAQIPPSNVFSKMEMSKFLKRKNISPAVYLHYTQKQIETSPVSSVVGIQRNETIGTSQQLKLAYKGGYQLEEGLDTADSSSPTLRREGAGMSSLHYNGNVKASDDSNKNIISQFVLKDQKSKRESLLVEDNNVSELVSDMCSSAAGVVRLQSRKKAEMFLVRTDGFSCTREKVNESSLAFTHPSTQQQMLLWKSTPRTILLLKKLGPALMEEAKEVASFLYHQERMNVLVEPDVHDIFARIPGFGFVQTFYNQDTSNLHERVDLIVCLGGDGVILHASNLFRGAVPPVVSFNLGSLGFLTSHKFEDYKQDLRQAIRGNSAADGVYITLRMRLRCEIFRNGKAMPGKVFDVLNEAVVDRGSNPYLSKIECYEHDHLITKVQGDGVIVATPTGSTAYSTAAGGSMVHPSVPCMLFTPICPHSLSFRPVILPDNAKLELKIPEDARSNAWVSFDGKRRQQLSRGDSVHISMSQHPLPTVNKSDQTCDWFRSLIRCLNWNERREQKAL